jgi:Ca2+-binding RTX toxin-like protein
MPVPTVWRNEYLINDFGTSLDTFPVVAAMANGGFALTWYRALTSPGFESVRGTIRTADGDAINSFLQEFTIAQSQSVAQSSSVSGLPDGRIVFSWAELNNAGETDVLAQVLNPDGTTFSDRFTITQTIGSATDDQDLPTVLGLSNGDLMVGYRDTVPATDSMRVRPYHITGSLVGGNTISSTLVTDSVSNNPQLAELGNGNVVVTWTSGTAGAPQQVFGIRESSGLQVLAETDVNPEDGDIERLSGDVVVLADGNFVILFERIADINKLQGRLFNQDGVALGGRFDISTGAGNEPSATALHDGRFMVAFVANGDIFGRIMFADGTPDGAQFAISNGFGVQNSPSIATLADGRVVVSWTTDELGNTDIFAEIYDPRETGLTSGASSFADDWAGTAFADSLFMGLGNDSVVGGAGADSLYGEAGADSLLGQAGNDLIMGGNGGDTLDGGADNDLIYGGIGNDSLTGGLGTNQLWGGAGADAHIGGTGTDYARYDDANHGNLVISLAAPGSNTGAAAGDTYTGIEGLVGGLGNDTVTGDGQANILFGGGGNDFVSGGTANDTLFGEAGGDNLWGGTGADAHYGGTDAAVDYARYDEANHGNLTISLLSPGTNTGAAAGDTYVGIEGLVGGAGNDVVVGDAAANWLFGSAGNDFIDALAGNDYLNGGAGADRFRFSTALGGANVDTIADFAVGVDDILLAQAIFAAIGPTLTADEFRIGMAADGNDFLLYNPGTGQLFYDSNASTAGGMTHFATVTINTALTATDFVMV